MYEALGKAVAPQESGICKEWSTQNRWGLREIRVSSQTGPEMGAGRGRWLRLYSP